MRRQYAWLFALGLFLLGLSAAPAHSGALSPDLQKALESSKYVYLQSTRQDGALSKAAEIWFMVHNGAVWVCSPTDTHRVKRIKAGKTDAKIAVGKPDGPSFKATGSLVKDAEANKALFAAFAKKYAGDWTSYEKKFREDLADGSRTLVKYDPQ
ncbi:MAG: hypothetical protein HYZ50_08140 [Deltaproteobacteria bacterium]|nr:hypothetical protein [Deltaproteobacteria bacterium]